ncbi:MAG: amidohydrolase family protein [Bdellovibrionaceae bacterium]|nr:amidohydrolase family protein [Pseudobdellovibrionaceae bacterium]
MVSRNCLLAELTGTRLHCLSISTAGSLRILEEARQRGTPVTCSVTPHHLALEDECMQRFDSNWKVNPPLRTRRDREALKDGLRRGVVTVLTSDHQPHCTYEKEVELDDAPCGAAGLEVALGVFLTELVHGGVLGLERLVALLTEEPARLLRVAGGTLVPGSPADVTVIDPNREWVVDPGQFLSKSHNTPVHRNAVERAGGAHHCGGP